MLCLHRPSGLELLPHLKTLKWSTNGSTTPILPFLSARLKILEVNLTGDSQSVDEFFRNLAGRTPHLTDFTLRTQTAAKDIERPLRKAIGNWGNLETLTLPPYYLRPSILEVVASLPNLTGLESDYTHYSPYDAAAILQKLPDSAFPKLSYFCFNSSPSSAQRLALKHSDLFARLTSIHIDAANGVGDEDVLKFIRHLGRNCVQLINIALNLCLGLGTQVEVTTPLSFGVLEGLFPCQQLEMVAISHPYPLTIPEADVARMALAWPKLKIFDICKEPDTSLAISGDMGNSLSILSTFAEHFPNLKDLGLYFAKDQSFSFSGNLYPSFEFRKLENLCVGVSAVPGGRSQDVGFLVASLCAVEPNIETGMTVWYVGIEAPEWEEHKLQWEETTKFLQFAMRTKIARGVLTEWALL